jgi:Domain of unknown function (DUF4279)
VTPQREGATSGPVDPFGIDINLAHPTWDPLGISRELSLEPSWSWKRGDRLGNVVKRSSRWYGQLVKGSGVSEYHAALEQVVSFLAEHEAFFAEFRKDGGDLEFVLNHAVVEQAKGKALELYLSPAFMEQLSRFGAGLRVQAWTDNPSWSPDSF